MLRIQDRPPTASARMTPDWLVSYRPDPTAATRIVAIPHAGAGPTVFRQAAALLPAGLELLAVELPGHGRRLSEPPFDRSAPLVAALLPAVADAVRGRDWMLFGHSMGAFLAFELCRALRRAGLALPRRLVVSGRRPPDYPAPELDLHRLPDDEFVHELTRRYDGIPAVIRGEPELMRLFLPVLKADFAVFETYRYVEEPPLDLPIAIWGGRDDPQTAQMDGWAGLASGPASRRLFDGGHFYLTDRPDRFARALAEEAAQDQT